MANILFPTSSTSKSFMQPIGAKDPDGFLAALNLDSSGNLRVTGSFTPPALQNVNLTQVGGAAIALGQTTMSASFPVVIASNQSAIPVTGSFTNTSIGAIGSPVPTDATFVGAKNPTGDLAALLVDNTGALIVAATLTPPALQDVNLTQIGGAAITLGQALMVASVPVVLASDQTPVPVTGSFTNTSIGAIGDPVPTDATFIGAQTAGGDLAPLLVNGSGALEVAATITPSGTQDVNLTEVGGAGITLGQKTMSASVPVVLASDQSPIPTTNSTDVATAFTTDVVTTTGATAIEITPITDQIGIEINMSAPQFVYWGPDNTVSSTTRPFFQYSDPLRRVTNASIWVALASGATDVDLYITRWTS